MRDNKKKKYVEFETNKKNRKNQLFLSNFFRKKGLKRFFARKDYHFKNYNQFIDR